MIQNIYGGKQPQELMVVWVRSHTDRKQGPEFFTPNSADMQVGFLKYPERHVIEAHRHMPVSRILVRTPETLVICRGKLAFDIYTDLGSPVFSGVAEAGDVLILLRGAHGFRVLEDVEILEVKQGPYKPGLDKVPLFEKEGES